MCTKCNNTGLIPFVKDGKVIPYTFQDCDCKAPEPIPYRPLQPEDFDFPVSRDFYRFYCSKNHWPDPGRMEEDRPRAVEPMKRIGELIPQITPRTYAPQEQKTKSIYKDISA